MTDPDRPLVTFALFAFNQERYIEEAVEAALLQSYEPLEIIISDDCSTDRTFDLIQQTIARTATTKRVVINRNHENIGTSRHVGKILEMAAGEFVVMAAGDDISIAGRTEFLVERWLATGKAECSIFTNATVINEFGDDLGKYYKAPKLSRTMTDFLRTRTCWVGGFSQGFSKALCTDFAPMPPDTFQEDGVISFRALLRGGILYFDDVTVAYRRHGQNSYDPTLYRKLKRLYRSEIGMIRGRLSDLATHSRLSLVEQRAVEHTLRLDLYKRLVIVNVPGLVALVLLVRRLKGFIRSVSS